MGDINNAAKLLNKLGSRQSKVTAVVRDGNICYENRNCVDSDYAAIESYTACSNEPMHYVKANTTNTIKFKLPGGFSDFPINRSVHITQVLYRDPATIVFWSDGTKTITKCGKNDTYNPEFGLLMCISKKFINNDELFNTLRNWLPPMFDSVEYTIKLKDVRNVYNKSM